MSHPICAVPGCSGVVDLVRFPRYPKKYKEWLVAIKNRNLVNIPHRIVFKRKRVCIEHFDPVSYVINTAEGRIILSHNAVPSRNLPGQEKIYHCIPLPRCAAIMSADPVAVNNFSVTLKNTTTVLSQMGQYCTLSFELVPIKPFLKYNMKNDMLIGLCSDPRDPNILATHALVFMLQGIYIEWRQIAGFLFCRKEILPEILIQSLKDVLACASIVNLRVLATICAPSFSNIYAMNILKLEAHQRCNHTPTFNRYDNFFFDGKSVAIIYNPPDLLKKTSEEFRRKKFKFLMGSQKCVASWQDISCFSDFCASFDDFDKFGKKKFRGRKTAKKTANAVSKNTGQEISYQDRDLFIKGATINIDLRLNDSTNEGPLHSKECCLNHEKPETEICRSAARNFSTRRFVWDCVRRFNPPENNNINYRCFNPVPDYDTLLIYTTENGRCTFGGCKNQRDIICVKKVFRCPNTNDFFVGHQVFEKTNTIEDYLIFEDCIEFNEIYKFVAGAEFGTFVMLEEFFRNLDSVDERSPVNQKALWIHDTVEVVDSTTNTVENCKTEENIPTVKTATVDPPTYQEVLDRQSAIDDCKKLEENILSKRVRESTAVDPSAYQKVLQSPNTLKDCQKMEADSSSKEVRKSSPTPLTDHKTFQNQKMIKDCKKLDFQAKTYCFCSPNIDCKKVEKGHKNQNVPENYEILEEDEESSSLDSCLDCSTVENLSVAEVQSELEKNSCVQQTRESLPSFADFTSSLDCSQPQNFTNLEENSIRRELVESLETSVYVIRGGDRKPEKGEVRMLFGSIFETLKSFEEGSNTTHDRPPTFSVSKVYSSYYGTIKVQNAKIEKFQAGPSCQQIDEPSTSGMALASGKSKNLKSCNSVKKELEEYVQFDDIWESCAGVSSIGNKDIRWDDKLGKSKMRELASTAEISDKPEEGSYCKEKKCENLQKQNEIPDKLEEGSYCKEKKCESLQKQNENPDKPEEGPYCKEKKCSMLQKQEILSHDKPSKTEEPVEIQEEFEDLSSSETASSSSVEWTHSESYTDFEDCDSITWSEPSTSRPSLDDLSMGDENEGQKSNWMDTVKMLTFFGKLYGSVSGGYTAPFYKKLCSRVTARSPHWKEWNSMIPVLQSMKEIWKNGAETQPESVKLWISTVCGFMHLWKDIVLPAGFSYMVTGRLIRKEDIRKIIGIEHLLDAEQFLKKIESHVEKTSRLKYFEDNPVMLTVEYLKKDLLNYQGSMSNPDWRTTVSMVIIENHLEGQEIKQDNFSTPPPLAKFDERKFFRTFPRETANKYIAKKVYLLLSGKQCPDCTNLFFGPVNRPRTATNLRFSDTGFTKAYAPVAYYVIKVLPRLYMKSRIMREITHKIREVVNLDFLNCKVHKLSRLFLFICIRYLILIWIWKLNRYLTGENKITYASMNPFAKEAMSLCKGKGKKKSGCLSFSCLKKNIRKYQWIIKHKTTRI